MEKQVSIRAIFWMSLLVVAGTLTAQRAFSRSEGAPDTVGFKEFHTRIEEYEKLHKNAEKSLPALKKTSKQEVIAAQQLALVNKIRELRNNAKRGDIFTPSATQEIALAIKAVFSGSDAHRVENTLQAGDPLEGFEVQVNQKYPDSLPFTTVPPTLLRKLPRLPDEVAYRILGSALLLVDLEANLIVDFMPNAIP